MASIRVRCKGGTFSGISGRVGDFVFRAYSDETMLVFYQPRKKKGEKDLSRMDREWTEDESIRSGDKNIAKMQNIRILIICERQRRNDMSGYGKRRLKCMEKCL